MTPQFRIIANRRDITAQIADRLLGLTVTDEAGMQSDKVSIRIDNRDGAVALPAQGAQLDVYVGYAETGIARMGLYTVDELSESGPPATLTITGKAADMRDTLKEKRTQAWEGMTLGDLIRAVAARNGYTATVADALDTLPVAHIDQTEESDMHLLTRLAKEHDAVAKPAGGKLIFVPRGEAKTVTGKSMPAVALSRTDILQWNVTLDGRGKYPSVRASFHDAANAIRTPVDVGSGSPVRVLSKPFPDAATALAAAQAEYHRQQRGTGRLSLTVSGNPALAAEAKLTISGNSQASDGHWTITRVEHSLTPGEGYRCEIEAEVPKG